MAERRDEKRMIKSKTARILALVLFLTGVLLGIFDAPQYWNSFMEWARTQTGAPFFLSAKLEGTLARPYRLGLDIQGGTHLVYQADVGNIVSAEQASSMDAVRDVVERRVNFFGVAEPVVQVERQGSEWRLIVELAGVKDISEAIKLIGATPYLEFREERQKEEGQKILSHLLGDKAKEVGAETLCAAENIHILTILLQQYGEDPCFVPTSLSGRYVKRAGLDFDQTTFQPQISLELTKEGTDLFADITKRNVNKRLAIYLDGAPISAPVVREEITGGKAQITGNFTPQSAKELVGRLNAGALPVPIKLVAQQTVQASLGQESLAKSLWAGLIGFIAVALFMVFWYRLPGCLAVLALLLYVAMMLAIFKLIPVTLTVAGIAGFILSIGMAVDANILIFERMKEELRQGKILEEAIREGFGRAWTSIRDSNVSSLITSGILYWLGTSVVQGFALTLSVGIFVSMFSAISVTRTLLLATTAKRLQGWRFLFLSGFSR